MLNLTLSIEAATTDEIELNLEHITHLVSQGFTSGIQPTWDITGEEEDES